MWEMVRAGFWRLRVRCALALCQALRRRVGHPMGQSSHPHTLLCRTCVLPFDRAISSNPAAQAQPVREVPGCYEHRVEEAL